jgi:hypothetical protein
MSESHSGIPESPLLRVEYRVFVWAIGKNEAEARGYVEDFVANAQRHGCGAELDESEPVIEPVIHSGIPE